MSLYEDRLSAVKDAYAEDDISEHMVEQLLYGIVRDEPPFYRYFVLKQADTIVGAGAIKFCGMRLERDGDLYRLPENR